MHVEVSVVFQHREEDGKFLNTPTDFYNFVYAL